MDKFQETNERAEMLRMDALDISAEMDRVRAVDEFEEADDVPFEDDGLDESMDGDAESALASAGFGTDEDYGYYGGGEDY